VNESIKILLIEDNPADVRLIREMLTDGGLKFSLESAGSLSEGLELISDKGVDIILLDLGLPDSSGFDTFLEMRTHVNSTPIVILSGQDDEDLALKSVTANAQDYLVKGEISARTITQSVRYAIERKLAEEELKESEGRFRSFFDLAADLACIADIEGYFREVNESWEKVLGYSRQELKGKPFLEFVHPDDRDRTLKVINEKLEHGETVFSFENRYLRKDGGVIWLAWTSRPIPETGLTYAVARDITQQKRAEAEREQYYNFFQSSTDLMVIADPNGAFLKTNPACTQILGYSEQELVAKPFVEFVHPEDKQVTLDEMARQQKIGSSFNFENRYVCKDGSIRWLSWRAIYNKDEGLTYATARDTTELKQTEEALRESEERLRITLEETQIGVMDWDLINDIWYASPTYYTMLGYEPEAGPADRSVWMDRGHPADRGEVAEQIRNVLIGIKSEYQYEARIRHADGSYRWQSVLGHTIEWDKDGKPARLIGVRIDVEEHKQAELALAESETKLRAIFEQSRDAIGVSKAGILLMVNPAYVKLFGYETETELVGSSVLKLTAPEEREKVAANVQRREVGKGASQIYETRGLRKDGSEFDLEVGVSTYDLDNETYTLVMLRDISEHKILEESLRHAQKMESVGRLAGGVAHDFNNFLTAVEGYIDLALLELPDGGSERKHLLEARHSAERAANLTRQLLLFSRREPLKLRTVNLNITVSGLLKMLERLMGEQYAIAVSLNDALPPAKADSGQIEQVLMNLMVNARDAMDGGGEILIGTEKVQVDESYVQSHVGTHAGDFVRLYVKDQGSGMDANTLSHVFDPFFSTKGAGTGTGLGLSVAYGIMAQHGGWIDVESMPGVGSTFSIYLPALPLKGVDAEAKAVPTDRLRGQGEKILLVEDEEMVRTLAEKILRGHEYTVFSAASAEEALELFEEENGDFRLVFSDVILPGMDGIALIDRLIEREPKLCVMLASGFAEGSAFKTIRDKGYPLLEKPYARTELLDQVQAVLKEE
jgi:PAS domain S-box-containing protein